MKAKKLWTIQSFLSCFIWNGVLIAFLFIISLQMLEGYQQWVQVLMASGDGALPENIKSGLVELKQLLDQTQQYLAPVIFGAGGLFTLILWLFLLLHGRGLARRAAAEAVPHRDRAAPDAESPREKKPKEAEAPPPPVAKESSSPQAAVQLLAILQREGRFVDFLQEDLSAYDDAQIGAAVRSIHQGCKQGLASHIELKPVFDKEEGSEVTIPANFDPNTIRLTGNVAGDPPFTGLLRHRGWQTVKVELPVTSQKDRDHWIVAPAEVEIGG